MDNNDEYKEPHFSMNSERWGFVVFAGPSGDNKSGAGVDIGK
jgi:hypothetical protein